MLGTEAVNRKQRFISLTTEIYRRRIRYEPAIGISVGTAQRRSAEKLRIDRKPWSGYCANGSVFGLIDQPD